MTEEIDLQPILSALRWGRGQDPPGAVWLSNTLGEFDAWLADDRQWRNGQAQHWRTLIHDLGESLALVIAMTARPVQGALEGDRDELNRLRVAFSSGSDASDDALRRQLLRVAASIRTQVEQPSVLVTAWRRIVDWAPSNPVKAEEAVGALRDLAEMLGHDGKALLDRIDRVLRDSGVDIADLAERALPVDPRSRAGESSTSRLKLVEVLLTREPPKADGVVWLEYLHAHLYWPPTLEIGGATLYQHNFLRAVIHQDPNDDRLPPELRYRENDDDFLLGWLGASDPEQSVQADYEKQGDPRVYLRLVLPQMPGKHLLKEARETAEFLAAYGSLGSENHHLWVLGDSYFIVGSMASVSAVDLAADQVDAELANDGTALQLSRDSEAIGRHLPISVAQLRLAARLVVWMRQASATDNPTRVVLCDRAVEQVCGWAGVTKPERFIREYLKPAWVYTQIRNSIDLAYRQFRYSPFGLQGSWPAIDVQEQAPPHSPQSYLGGRSLKGILENMDALLEAAPSGSVPHIVLERLANRLASPDAVSRWLLDLESEFDARNARLRRTRNAIMHGGPINRSTVDSVSDFALSLAYHALGRALRFLLDDADLVDAFLNLQDGQRRCFSQLRAGVPAAEALFWTD